MPQPETTCGSPWPLALDPARHPRAPAGWLARAISQRAALEADLAAARLSRPEGVSREEILERRWRQLGLRASELSATVVWPIRNEANSLDSTLRAALASHVPTSAGLLLLLVCNGCSDGSEAVAGGILDELERAGFEPDGEAAREALRLAAPEAEVGRLIRRNRLSLALLTTPEPGKSKVLNLANQIARCRGDDVAVSFDADLWLEPETLPLFLATILEVRTRHPGDAVVFFGQTEAPIPVSASLFNRWTRWFRGPHRPGVVQRGGCPGWVMAWDTTFMAQEGGFWPTALVDNQLGGRARMRGRRIHYSEACVWGWGYNAASEPLDWFRLRVRMTRGYYQNLRACRGDRGYPEFVRFFWGQSDLTRPWGQRVRRLGEHIRARRRRTLLFLIRYLLGEVAHIVGWIACARRPNDPTWPVIHSTK